MVKIKQFCKFINDFEDKLISSRFTYEDLDEIDTEINQFIENHKVKDIKIQISPAYQRGESGGYIRVLALYMVIYED